MLKGGWNAIHLSGDASYNTIENLLPDRRESGAGIQPQSGAIHLLPAHSQCGYTEWSTWRRSGTNSLTELIGPGAYMDKSSGSASDSYSVAIQQRPKLPSGNWVRNGANLFGFPSSNAAGSYPKMSDYFATFPAAIAAGTKIYKYVGGELGPGNPVQVFAPTFEQLDRTQAYWFSAEVVGDFIAPVQLSLSSNDGLDFGRTRSVISVRLRNRSDATVTVTLAPVSSEAAPIGQTAITGAVPLTLRDNDGNYNALNGAVNQVIAPQSTVSALRDRPWTHERRQRRLLRIFVAFTDNSQQMDIALPVQARVSSLAGLWVGDALVSNVNSKSPAQAVAVPRVPSHCGGCCTSTSRHRALALAGIHRLLGNTGNPVGITLESSIHIAGSARRLVAAHMPLDTVVATGSGSVALGGTLQRGFTIPYNDPTNPFVPSYHPDHDNKHTRPDGNVEHLVGGNESYSITREVSFEFTTTPPNGVSPIGWGNTVLGGNYTETIRTQNAHSPRPQVSLPSAPANWVHQFKLNFKHTHLHATTCHESHTPPTPRTLLCPLVRQRRLTSARAHQLPGTPHRFHRPGARCPHATEPHRHLPDLEQPNQHRRSQPPVFRVANGHLCKR